MEPIGIEHFFDAFSLEQKRPLKVDAASALNIPVKEVSDLLVVSQVRAKRFELTPVWAPVEPPTKRAKMILQMCLIWKNSTKRILTSVLSRKEWTLERDGSGNPNDEVPGIDLLYLAG